METNRDFSRTFLLNSFDAADVEVMVNKTVDVGRWSVSYDYVFKYEGKFYSAPYSVGATEMQDEGPWEYDDDPVTVVIVEPVEVTVIEYVSVKKDEEKHGN
jgi:hypothetical protein